MQNKKYTFVACKNTVAKSNLLKYAPVNVSVNGNFLLSIKVP